MRRLRTLGRVWLWLPCAVVVLALSGFAVQQSVSVRASWSVLPYQTLQLADSQQTSTSVDFEAPEPGPLDYARGFIDRQHAVRLHVVSNTPWTIQVHMNDPDLASSAGIQLRSHGGEYVLLSSTPQILAQGMNGVFEISVDYRWPIGADGTFASESPRAIVFTIMSE